METRYQLLNRYVFSGDLVMQTGLHIGGGKFTLSASNNPIVLTPENMPFIPGSSFKGALRSTVEKLTASLSVDTQLKTCGLPTQESTEEDACPTTRQSALAARRRANPDQAASEFNDELAKLCHTCQLFGSPFAAARLLVDDLYLKENEWSGSIQVRDGVAIDRDSETARNRLKYDFEVVPSTTVFSLRLILENATQEDLQLISIGLSEFVHGFGGIGGKRSRGLGACTLNNLQIACLDLAGDNSQKRLQNYLLKKELLQLNAQEIFKTHINKIFASSATQ